MLRQQLQEEQIAALKAGEKEKLNALRYIVSQIKYKEIEKQSELGEEEVVSIIRKQIKELNESIEMAQKQNRPDLVEENQRQVELEAEVQKLVESNKDAIDKNAKAIIGIAMGTLKSKADPSRIQATLRKLQLM
jgi:uncharacterized protein YqeY